MAQETKTSIDVGTAFRILLYLENGCDDVPMNNLKQEVKGVYKTKSSALDFLLDKKLIKQRVVDSGKRTSTVLLSITMKGSKKLGWWCNG